MADRFYSSRLPRDGRLLLEGDEAKHLARVARRQVGDQVEVFSGRGDCFLAEIVEIGRDRVTLEIRAAVPDRRAPIDLVMLVSPPKGDRFDWLVEKATEVGVTRLVPILCERSVVDPRSSKIDRLRRTIIESSKQCGRNRLMQLDEPKPLSQLLNESAEQSRYFTDFGGLEPESWPTISRGSPAAIAIGPEGGWSDRERSLASDAGWMSVSLGPTRLRVETAAIVGAAVVFSKVDSGESS